MSRRTCSFVLALVLVLGVGFGVSLDSAQADPAASVGCAPAAAAVSLETPGATPDVPDFFLPEGGSNEPMPRIFCPRLPPGCCATSINPTSGCPVCICRAPAPCC